MVIYPLDEVLWTTLVGRLRRAEDLEEIELIGQEPLDGRRKVLAYESGIPRARTFRKIFRLRDPLAWEKVFASWVASLQERIRGVVAIDGKTLRGSKTDAHGTGALHRVSASVHDAGPVIGQRAVAAKSNEITASPEPLDLLDLSGAVVTLDAMATPKALAGKITEPEGDDLLALKGNQESLHDDAQAFFDDPARLAECAAHRDIHCGHGRIEERLCPVAEAGSWLAERHPDGADLTSIAQITATPSDKKSGQTSCGTRLYIISLRPDPAPILAASRSHGSIENNLHRQLHVTVREDECRARKDNAPLNLAIIRHAAYNRLKRNPAKLSMKRKRLKAALNPDFRGTLPAR